LVFSFHFPLYFLPTAHCPLQAEKHLSGISKYKSVKT